MHMADALISVAVGGTMDVVTLGAMSYSVKKVKNDFDEKKLPLMGVMGAFVFAGQMINFTIPGTGSSGHIGGAILLATLLGPYPAFLTMAAVLLIQALLFADGGLLAYGCNVFNMGFYACFLAFPLIVRPILKRGLTKRNITIASILGAVLSLQLGAFSVVLETKLSGITALPFSTFVWFMQPIHLAIGLVEGILTALVLCFVHDLRPEILNSTINSEKMSKTSSLKKVLLIGGIATLLIGSGLSLAASSHPDGLEWSIEKVTGDTELEADGTTYETAENVQEKTALLPDYSWKENGEDKKGTMFSGAAGSLITLGVCVFAGYVIMRVKRRGTKKA